MQILIDWQLKQGFKQNLLNWTQSTQYILYIYCTVCVTFKDIQGCVCVCELSPGISLQSLYWVLFPTHGEP